MAQERDIKYVNREFGDLRQELIEYARNYFSDTYNDFSPTSPGMMFVEMAAYVGDILSFYQDTQLQETFLQHAKSPGNLYNLAYMMGYRPKVTSASEVDLEVSLRVGADSSYEPTYPTQGDGVLGTDTVFRASSGNGTRFNLKNPVDFSFSSSLDPTVVTINSLDNSDNPVDFLLTKKAKAFAGDIVSTERTIETTEKFLTLTIDDSDIIGILDITDGDGNFWYEVPFLAQDTVFTETVNSESDSGLVPNNLTLTRTPRRFVTRFNSTGQLQIQFGAGITGDEDNEITPNPTNVGLGTAQGVSKLDTAYDPSNFLFTQTYGLAPSAGTTLTIRYLKGGGVGSNEDANTVTEIVSIGNSSLVIGDLSVTNPQPARGGKDGDTLEELRQNSLRAFNEQNRTVTLQDYAVRALSLPPRFGSVVKAYAAKDDIFNRETEQNFIQSNPLAVSLYVLSQNSDGHLTTASTNLKENLRKYLSQYIMITDAVTIKDAFVVNIGIEFEIIPLPNAIGREVLLRCTNRLIEYFNISNWSINQPINLSPLYTILDRLKGVQSVQDIKIINKVGTIGGRDYSQYAYDITNATKRSIIYPSYDPCIFEVKYPQFDIKGKITTV